MLAITLICVGKLKEPYLEAAFAEYRKRLGGYCRFTLTEIQEQRLPDEPAEREIAAALEREAAEVEKRIPAGAALVAMCVEGTETALCVAPAAERLTVEVDAACCPSR